MFAIQSASLTCVVRSAGFQREPSCAYTSQLLACWLACWPNEAEPNGAAMDALMIRAPACQYPSPVSEPDVCVCPDWPA